MADKPDQGKPLTDEQKERLEVLNLEGRHEGHILRRVGIWALCSCAKEVLWNA